MKTWEVSVNGRNMLHICVSIIEIRGYYFRFSSVFIKKKKVTKPVFFKKKQNRTRTGSNRPVSVHYFGTKTGSNRFGSVFFCFFSLARFFSGLARFFSVRFFQFHAYKTKTEPVYFFKILISLIGFFS
jgi:hypothetical protein